MIAFIPETGHAVADLHAMSIGELLETDELSAVLEGGRRHDAGASAAADTPSLLSVHGEAL
jgi:hypothetical protein